MPMLRFRFLCFIISVLGMSLALTACVPVSSTSSSTANSSTGIGQNAVLKDQAFQNNIKSIRLLLPDEELLSAAVRIGDATPVTLVYDVLELGNENSGSDYRAKIIHCNADWRESNLSNMDFLYEYNEFRITNEAFSYNTQVPFTQYRMPLPQLKLPGNYIVWVFEGGNESNVVFTKRFMVYDQRVSVSAEVKRSSGVAERMTNHQLEFVVDYGGINVPNPLQDIYVVIRQNNRWFNAISGIKPTFIRDDRTQLEYLHFDLQNNFRAGAEYRYFDLRTLDALGQNVGEIRQDEVPIQVYLLPDRDRGTQVYSQYEDLDGAYIVGNLDNQGGELNADYVKTHFFLESETSVNGDVYVVGAFNNRALTAENRMTYDAAIKGYKADLLLKQGFYNYQYYVAGDQAKNPYRFEGSFFETENQYEILVYTRPIGARGDLLVGYTSVYSGGSDRRP